MKLHHSPKRTAIIKHSNNKTILNTLSHLKLTPWRHKSFFLKPELLCLRSQISNFSPLMLLPSTSLVLQWKANWLVQLRFAL